MLTTEQILALAPDPASAKAGSGQANLSYWSGLGGDASALWGLCQGSGKEPYRTQIELASPAFKCSCPSRKFPCKHGLGLYLLYAKQSAAFSDNTQPDWVADWLQSRGQRSEQQAAKAAAKAQGAAEADANLSPEQIAAKEKASQKRQDKRQNNVAQGVALLDTWLADLAREGLAGLRSKPASAWEAMAARMVDAQASGLASRIRRAGMLIYGSSQPDWEVPLARELGYLALLSQCQQKLEQFSPEFQCDIRSAIGWVAAQEDALATPALADALFSLGCATQTEERISRRACYLRGQNSGRFAMLLQFAAGGQALPSPLIPGTAYQGSLHFYPGATPLRAVFAQDMQLVPADSTWHNAPSLDQQLQDYAEQLARNPLLEQAPMLLNAMAPQLGAPESWHLRSASGACIPIERRFKQGWLLHALAGGAGCSIFGLWDGYSMLPLTFFHADSLHNFDVPL